MKGRITGTRHAELLAALIQYEESRQVCTFTGCQEPCNIQTENPSTSCLLISRRWCRVSSDHGNIDQG